MYTKLELFIDGKWIAETTSGAIDILNPADGTSLGAMPCVGTEELALATAAANRAFAGWKATPAIERARIMHKAAELMRERVDHIATVLTLEQGKVTAEAKGEVVAGSEFIDWYAEEGRRSYGRLIPARTGNMVQSVTLEPVGPVACFSPWNFPAVTPLRKIAAALAAGCTVIAKPSEETPGTLIEIMRAFQDAGLPDGVLNLVFGDPALVSDYLIKSPVIRKISFTGSTAVGRKLAALAGENLTQMTMELGGHAPVIVARDADIEHAAKTSMAIKMRNAGQVCTSPTRFFVEKPVYKDYLDACVEIVSALKIGNGLDPQSNVGPLANSRRIDAMDTLIGDAVSKGAKLLTGGEKIAGPGFAYKPAIVAELPENARALTEEPFGPLALIQPVEDLDDALTRANSLSYGLAGYAFTKSSATAHQISQRMEVGVIGINQMVVSIPENPFGGIHDSGWGREGGSEGIDAYTVTKYVGHHII